FCKKHGLTDPKLARVVERHIVDNIRNLPDAKLRAIDQSSERQREDPTFPPARRHSHDNSFYQNFKEDLVSPANGVGGGGGGGGAEGGGAGMAAALSASQLRCAKLEEREAELEARLEQAAEREAQQTKEMDELHAANARIAKLAFAQVGSREGRESETRRGGEI
ncbi:MAG: hypothetical protein SGPRY_005151, partial [Prymnesium sp.]